MKHGSGVLIIILNRFTLIFLLLLTNGATAQVVYENTGHEVYDLLDELAGEQIVEINSVVKPYSRIFIAEKLQQALDQKERLSPRLLDEI